MTDIKQLLKTFERFVYGTSQHTAFTELLDWTLLPFKRFDSAAEQQQAFEAFRSHPKVDQLTTLITLIGEGLEEFPDPIGELFMQAISNGHNGQYFSPEPICHMMAAMSVGENSLPGQTVADCACGSARMLLAVAKINRHMKFYGADLDNTCCKMALINMLLNSLQGEIAHMNSLTNQFYTGYKVCRTLVNTHYIPYYIEFTEPKQSRIWLRDLSEKQPKLSFTTPFEPVRASEPINGVQGRLF